jgi:hypothetical protein
MTIHDTVSQAGLGFRSRFRSGCSLSLFFLAGCAALGGCQEPTAGSETGATALWRHRDGAVARSVPYTDDEIVVFNTHEAGRFVPYSTGARVHGDRIYLGTNYGGGEGFYALRIPR